MGRKGKKQQFKRTPTGQCPVHWEGANPNSKAQCLRLPSCTRKRQASKGRTARADAKKKAKHAAALAKKKARQAAKAERTRQLEAQRKVREEEERRREASQPYTRDS